MPLNPDAVGAAERARRGQLDEQGRPALRGRHRCRHRRAGVHDREHQRRRRSRCSRRSPSSSAGASGVGDGQDRHVQPGAARPRPAGGDAAPADPGRGHGDDRRPASRRCTTRARRPSSSPRPRRRSTASRCTPPARRRSSAARAAGAATAARPGPQNVPPERAPDHEVTYQTSPDQAFVYRLSRRPQPAAHRPGVRRAWAASTARSCTGCAATASPGGRCCTRCAAPTRRASTTSRAASPRRCMPGEALTIRAWETGDGEAVFTTSVGDRVVIDQGLLRYS